MAATSILTQRKEYYMAMHSRLLRPGADQSVSLTTAKDGSHPESVTFVFYDADGNLISNPCPAEYDPVTGRVTFGSPATGNLYYCVITDDTGNMYSIAFGGASGQHL